MALVRVRTHDLSAHPEADRCVEHLRRYQVCAARMGAVRQAPSRSGPVPDRRHSYRCAC
jgi:hypothetical protein